jgi:hypothetical protein
MDGWRIRSAAHDWVATRLSHEDRATLVVWRDGRYVELRVSIPERWLGVEILNYRPPAGTE